MISMNDWSKSTYSTGGSGNCVEVRGRVSGREADVQIRDTQNRGLGSVDVPPAAFASVASLLKVGK